MSTGSRDLQASLLQNFWNMQCDAARPVLEFSIIVGGQQIGGAGLVVSAVLC
jgi:hypothetical protein